MKNLIRLLLIIPTTLTLVLADVELLPPKDLRAEWKELKEQKFSDWTIKSFLGWDIAGDGGSKVFFFESNEGKIFELMIASPEYWNAEDKKEGRQVFLVSYKNRFYRIEPKSEEEKNIIEKLNLATDSLIGEGKKDPKLLKELAQRLESRAPAFKPN